MEGSTIAPSKEQGDAADEERTAEQGFVERAAVSSMALNVHYKPGDRVMVIGRDAGARTTYRTAKVAAVSFHFCVPPPCVVDVVY